MTSIVKVFSHPGEGLECVIQRRTKTATSVTVDEVIASTGSEHTFHIYDGISVKVAERKAVKP